MNDFYGGLAHKYRIAELTAEADKSRLAQIARGSTATHRTASRGVRLLIVGALFGALIVVTTISHGAPDQEAEPLPTWIWRDQVAPLRGSMRRRPRNAGARKVPLARVVVPVAGANTGLW